MDLEKDLKHETQKQKLIQVAEEHFGKSYFEKLDQILSEIQNIDTEKGFEYTITVNSKGAFYAHEK